MQAYHISNAEKTLKRSLVSFTGILVFASSSSLLATNPKKRFTKEILL